MVNRSGDIGTKTETAVVRVLVECGFPHAERRRLRGRADAGDITGTPGVAWSVKGGNVARAASDNLVVSWLHRTEQIRRNAGADIGVLVLARRGIGLLNAGRWWAIIPADDLVRLRVDHVETWFGSTGPPIGMHLHQLCRLLRAAGYGTPPNVTRSTPSPNGARHP